ncbi:MAG: type IV pilus modification protein PilV [Casimicrobium sp.]
MHLTQRTSNPTRPYAGRIRQGGFSLLEILVTILIVAVGSLGIAGTILTGLQATVGAAERTIATQQIASFVEVMNTNLWLKEKTDNLGGGYGSPFNGIFTAPVCPAAGCNINDLRLKHLAAFRSNVAAALPGGLMRVQAVGNNPPMIAITVAWLEQSQRDHSSLDAATLAASSGCTGLAGVPASVNQCLTVVIPAK